MTDLMLPPGIAINDPRPIAAASPYTFFLPHADELAAVQQGDGIKLIFRQTEGDPEYSAERMWVLIESVQDGMVTGTLDNQPASMALIREGDRVTVPLSHAIGTAFRKDRPRVTVPAVRTYWDRCFVDQCVLDGRSHIDYLYREEPDMTCEGDAYPDSGWRIRGTQDAIDADAQADAHPQYIALGKVLNSNNGWLYLIDSPPGCAFAWDADSGTFVELD
ncbi:immunity protein Imm33 domain-containing protein [Aurantiacibacter rhizosphaerae]|uniref:DUF2185 domain-containing protein n=1 Tax=Aurantiacibacter rhizosphaerae TaxID=2691582 RepID=A0A844XGM9_9SPHN|nr:DUF2185 domain-containing protein [Aurantiacibacter rhizosphaerae]MWV28889.1 DUF2185 domain-containing protein [Aurantiacibacter rhizosphaerae]